MSRIWMALLALATVAACASNDAAKDNVPKEKPGATENREAVSDWQLSYFGTTTHTRQAFECAFARVPEDRVGVICGEPGLKQPSFQPLPAAASDEIMSAYESVDWSAEVEKEAGASTDVAPTRFVLKRPEQVLEVTRMGEMSSELQELEDALLSSVREFQDELRSETSAQRENEVGVCLGACDEDEWCEQVECSTAAPGPGAGDQGVRWNGPTNMCEEVGVFPVCQPLSEDGESCERHEECVSERCEGIISPVCVSKS